MKENCPCIHRRWNSSAMSLTSTRSCIQKPGRSEISHRPGTSTKWTSCWWRQIIYIFLYKIQILFLYGIWPSNPTRTAPASFRDFAESRPRNRARVVYRKRLCPAQRAGEVQDFSQDSLRIVIAHIFFITSAFFYFLIPFIKTRSRMKRTDREQAEKNTLRRNNILCYLQVYNKNTMHCNIMIYREIWWYSYVLFILAY